MKYIVSLLLFMGSYALHAQDVLSQLAKKHNTDKGMQHHAYTPIYDFYFSLYRNQPIKFLEIGFFNGSSAAMWDEYFPSAQLHFIDINQHWFKQCTKKLSSRCNFHVVDQSSAKQLKKFIQKVGGGFDLIVDDGGHTMEQQLVTFKELFPFVKDGGIYVIEDLHTSYWTEYGGNGTREKPKGGPGTMIYYLMHLVDDLNFTGARTGKANKDLCPESLKNTLTYYQRNIRSIHFYDSLCFIIKKEI